MAGSRVNIIYNTDIPDGGDGRKILILNLDEGNSETLGGVVATPGNIGTLEFAQQGADFLRLEPRYVLLEGVTSDGKIVRQKWIAPDPDNALVVNGGTTVKAVFVGNNTVEDVTFAVSGIVGEKRTIVKSFDTGLDDGDA